MSTSTQDMGPELDDIIQHLQSEEREAQAAALSSTDSLKLWIASHPVLSGSGVMESIAQVGPALLTMLQRLLGLG